MSNASSNNLLNQDGMFRQNQYYRRWLDSQQAVNPRLSAAINLGSNVANGNYDFQTSTPPVLGLSKREQEVQDYYDYWKDDGISGRDLTQGFGFFTGMPVTSLTDYAMGRNPAGDIGSYLGSSILGSQANSLQQAIALSNVGGIAGQEIGTAISPGQWTAHPGNLGTDVAKALGFQEGTREFDEARNVSMNFIAEEIGRGKSIQDVVKEADESVKNYKGVEYTGPIEVEEKSTGYGMQAPGESVAVNYAGVITEEPTTVNDFAGMFSSTIDGVGDWFSNAYDSVTGKFTGLSSNDYSNTGPVAVVGKPGDDTWMDSEGTTWHGSGYDWNNDGSSNDGNSGTSFGPSDYNEPGNEDGSNPGSQEGFDD